jgi:hypothetical protein
MPTLHLQVCAGFANRVRSLVSGICFAEDHGLTLVIHWFPASPECACRFSTVLDAESLPKTVKVAPEDLYMAKEVLTEENTLNAFRGWDRVSDLNWKSYGIFYKNSNWEKHLQNLRPSRLVKDLLERRCSQVEWSNAIGVHIRRTDNKKSIEGSPLESFLTTMREKPDKFFVVATDDAKVKETIEHEFLGQCIFPATTLTRRTEEGMVHGVADFFALTKCTQILGSTASSFSEMAARYGAILLEIATL